MPEIDLRGTQGAVILPGGTVTQHYPTPEQPPMTQTTNGDKAMHDRVYSHSEQLAALNARMSYMEATLTEIKSLLQRQQPTVIMNMQQLLLAVTVAAIVAAIIFGVSYAGQ